MLHGERQQVPQVHDYSISILRMFTVDYGIKTLSCLDLPPYSK